ncbi:hypothetical protein AB1Y20_001715 [Prymnesium parvum]|uniref:Uncharacterized protein n=1 Tax=Prymnesium parvum TaxID=97485 RepID=A0AB34K8J4_PRYPA
MHGVRAPHLCTRKDVAELAENSLMEAYEETFKQRHAVSPPRTREGSSPTDCPQICAGDVLLSTWLRDKAGIQEDELPSVVQTLADTEGIASLDQLRLEGLSKGGALVSDHASDGICLRPAHRLRINSALLKEEAEAYSAARYAAAARLASTSFFAAMLVLVSLLTYRKIDEALHACCRVPHLAVMQTIAGWLWSAEYVAPAIALLLLCWWGVLPVSLWRARMRVRAGLVASFPFVAFALRESDAAVGALIGLELAIMVFMAYVN